MNILKSVNLFSFHKTNNIFSNPPLFTGNFKPNFKGQLETDCFETEKQESKRTKYGTIHYLKNKNFADLEFEKPLSLSEALKCVKEAQDEYKLCNYGLAQYGYVYNTFDEAFSHKFKDMKFKRFLGAGNTAMAFENADGKVLKLSDKNQFVFREGPEDFDAKIYSKGSIKRIYFYYLQEKCSQEGITPRHVEQMEKMIAKKGYEPFDMSEMQLGFDKNGKLCLLDPECARDEEKYRDVAQQNAQWMQKYGLDIDYI